MSVVSNKRVNDAMIQNRIFISPYNPDFQSTSSYDVCLGEYFYEEQHPQFGNNIYNMYEQDQVKKLWGEPQLAFAVREYPSKVEDELLAAGFRPDDRLIIVQPGESILAHTEEFIGGRLDVTTMMKARSSTGRNLINVCQCAGWGDVGYINRWTMEITNRSPRMQIPLLVGERIAQIVFFDCPETKGDYTDKGNYQGSTNIEELRANWKPESMLPRTKRTKVVA